MKEDKNPSEYDLTRFLSEHPASLQVELERAETARKEILERIKEAEEIAKKYSEENSGILCYVSRYTPSTISLTNYELVFEISPEEYLKSQIGIGDFLGVVNLSTLDIILLEVVEIERADIMSMITRLPPITVPPIEASAILTPARITAKPILAMDKDGKILKPIIQPIEPQSPIFKPRYDVILKLIGMPQSGISLGCFVTGGGRPIVSIPVYFPLAALYQHILIIGTTGSGKTTFIKNFILSLLSNSNFYLDPSNEPTIITFDATGEYAQLILPAPKWSKEDINLEEEEAIRSHIYSKITPINEMIIMLPITKRFLRSCVKEAKSHDIKSIEDYARAIGQVLGTKYFYEVLGNIILQLGGSIDDLNVNAEIHDTGQYMKISLIIINFTATINGEKVSKTLRIIPWALRFSRLRDKVKELSPILSSQARYFFNRILSKTESLIGIRVDTLGQFRESLDTHLKTVSDQEHVHESTLKNILRSIALLDDSGLFDVTEFLGNEKQLIIDEPESYGKFLSEHKGRLIVIDLHYLEREEYIIVYRIIREVFKWKKESYEKGKLTQPVIMIIDEAHRYFPASGFGEREAVLMIERQLTYIARLGRMRGLSLIFATHSPDDVNSAILQLTNTKIAFRCEQKLLDKISIPRDYQRVILNAPDRVGLIRSHVYRNHYVLFKTTPPLAGHYDISAISLSD